MLKERLRGGGVLEVHLRFRIMRTHARLVRVIREFHEHQSATWCGGGALGVVRLASPISNQPAVAGSFGVNRRYQPIANHRSRAHPVYVRLQFAGSVAIVRASEITSPRVSPTLTIFMLC